jgi:hypothetical protein
MGLAQRNLYTIVLPQIAAILNLSRYAILLLILLMLLLEIIL